MISKSNNIILFIIVINKTKKKLLSIIVILKPQENLQYSEVNRVGKTNKLIIAEMTNYYLENFQQVKYNPTRVTSK